MLRSRRSSREEDSTTVAVPIGEGPLSPALVGVEEVVGVDEEWRRLGKEHGGDARSRRGTQQCDEDRCGRWRSCSEGDGATHTTGGRRAVTAEWTMGRGGPKG